MFLFSLILRCECEQKFNNNFQIINTKELVNKFNVHHTISGHGKSVK